MTPEKALQHFAQKAARYKNPVDIEAYNTLLVFYENQNKQAVNNYTMFAKMMLEFIKDRAMLKSWGMTAIMRQVEEILQTPLVYSIEDFKFRVPLFKFETIAHQSANGLHPLKDYGKIKKIREANMRANKRELEQALKTEWTQDQAIEFLEKTVNKLATKYSKTP